jgi:hypothetical protein
MQYYRFELDKESQGLCTIITPFDKYKYLRLPMRLKCSPDIAQAAMEIVLSDIKDANVYIDDVCAFSNGWERHVNSLATILWQLQPKGCHFTGSHEKNPRNKTGKLGTSFGGHTATDS